MQELNAAHETLNDPKRRRDYDRDLDESNRQSRGPASRIERNIQQDAFVSIDAFLRGASLDVQIRDPGNPNGAESYRLEIPPETAPGARFTLERTASAGGGVVRVRVKALPGFRFKVRNSDLRCDLRISSDRAARGGTEMMPGPDGRMLKVPIPARVSRGEVVRIAGGGLPRSRGGRGDLLVRVVYRPAVHISRSR